ncbi:MAG: hypothetical protein ACE361_09490 [Aureliella sp.]
MNLLQVSSENQESNRLTEQEEGNPARDVPVYNLVALVRTEATGISATAANMNLDSVSAGTVREALSRLVSIAKSTLASAERPTASDSSFWIDPPREAEESETRFVVPLHL